MPKAWELACWGSDSAQVVALARPELLDSVNYSGTTGLGIAAANGSAGVARALLLAGADPAIPDRYGCPPLIHAAARAHHECVSALLESGADPDIVASDGSTAVRAAATCGCLESLRALARHGANFEAWPKGQETPRLAWRSDAASVARLSPLVDAWFKPGAARAEREAWLLAQGLPGAASSGPLDPVRARPRL